MEKMKKLKASTLIETMVAMTIVMVSFAIVVTLMLGNSGNYSRLKLNAYLLCEDIKAETMAQNNYSDEEFEFENLIVYKSIEPYRDSKYLRILLIEAFKEELLYQNKEIITIEN